MTLTLEDKKPSDVQSGILILKKVPTGKKPYSSYHAAESTINEYRAEEPNFGSIVGKLLSAASSSNPDSPTPFTDYRQSQPQQDEYAGDDNGPSDDQHDQGNFDSDFELEPAFDSPEAAKVIAPESSGEVSLGSHNLKISQGIPEEAPPLPDSSLTQQKLPENPPSNFNEVQGSFINLAQDFKQLNPSINNFQNHDSNINFEQQNSQNGQHLVGGNFAEPPPNYIQDQNVANFQQEPAKTVSSNIFDYNFAGPSANLLHFNLDPSQNFQGEAEKFGSLVQLPQQLDKNDFTSNSFLGPYNPEYLKRQSQKGRRPQNGKTYDKYRGHLKTTPKINQNLVDPSANLDLPRFPPNHNSFPKANHSNFPPYPKKQGGSSNRPFSQNPSVAYRKKPSSTRSRQVSEHQFAKESPFARNNNQLRSPNFDIIQSVTYQLGQNGPMKI